MKNTKVAKAVAAVLRRGDNAGSMLGAAAGMSVAGPIGAAGGAAVGGFFGRMAGDKFELKESLESSLHDLREALQSSPTRLLIIIDDVDRLLPEELRQMLTLMKSLGNLPSVTYLLAYARDEVVDLIKRAGISNEDYLEKIVQVSFELTRVDRFALRNMLFSRLDVILSGDDLKDTSRWSMAFTGHIDPYLRTPRDVTRLCNVLQVVWPAVRGEVDWTDQVALEVLRLHEPRVYNLVIDKLDHLTGETAWYSDENAWASSLAPTAENCSNPEVATNALLYLFPRLEKVWKKYSYVSGSGSALRDRRIQCAEYARNYFALSPASDQFTSAQIRSLFSDENPKSAFEALLEIAKSRKTRQGQSLVCRLLEQIKEELPAAKLPLALARALFAYSDEMIAIRDPERLLFEVGNDLRLNWLIVEALRAYPESERAAVVKTWLSGPSSGAFLPRFIGTMTSKTSDRSESIFLEGDYDELRELASTSMRELAQKPDFLQRPMAGTILFSWGRLASFDEVRAWLRGRGETSSVIELASIIPHEVHSSSTGLTYRVDRESWSLLLDVDEFETQLSSVAASIPLGDARWEIIERYRSAASKNKSN